jgi:hypothetical protein
MGGGAAAGVTGSIGATGETGSGSGATDVTSRGGVSTARVGVIDGGSADGGFRTIGGVTLGRGRGRGVTVTTRGGTVLVGGRVEGVVLTGGVRVGGVALTSGTRVLGGCVDGVVEGRRFRIALKIAFSGMFTPTDVDEDEPLLGVLSGWVLLGGVVAAPVAERFGSVVGGAVTVGGAETRGVTWMVLDVVDVVCASAPNAAQPRISASALTSMGFAGRHIFLLPPRKI